MRPGPCPALVLLAVVLLSTAASAEEADAPVAGEVAAAGGGAEAGAEGEEAAPAEDPALEEARLHFEQGLRLVRREAWGPALAEFEESLRISPTSVAAFNRALCLKHLHRYPESLAAFEGYLERYADEIDRERRADVEAMMGEIRALLTAVTVRVNLDGATVVVDGEAVGTSPLDRPLLLLSGPHEIEVRLAEHEVRRRDIVVVAGRETTEEFVLVPRARRGRLRVESNVPGATVYVDDDELGSVPLDVVLPEGDHEVEVRAEGFRTERQTVRISADEDRIATLTLVRPTRAHRGWFWSLVGLTAAGALATTGLGVSVHMLDGDYDPAADDARDRYDQGRSLMIGTDVALGMTCAAAVAAVVLAFYTDWTGASAEGAEEGGLEGLLRMPAPAASAAPGGLGGGF